MKEKIIIYLILLLIIFTVIILSLTTKEFPLSSGIKSEKPFQLMDQNAEVAENNNQLRSKSSIFIPYWALPQSVEDIGPYDRLLYFGISVDENGIQKSDAGYNQLTSFQTVTKSYTGRKTLVIRMLNSQTNINILNDENMQNTIIAQINDVVKENHFSELALDLELSGLFLTDNTSKINIFVQKLYTLKNKHYRHFSVILYGDVFFRNRPYDVKTIGKYSDEIMIMAYDFSKPYGEPGPNMPFDRQSLNEAGLLPIDYGYDFKQMVSDFSSQISREKITVIFGMYGYDWTLNQQGTPLKRAEALTLKQINVRNQMSNVKNTTQKSKEKKIEYSDSEGQKHVIWYEDEESAHVKSRYLRDQGINSLGYWAFSYY